MMMRKISEIREEVEACRREDFERLYLELAQDERKSVRALLEKQKKYFEKERLEEARVKSMHCFERDLAGTLLFCGIDEAGRGPLAGPVVAAAVIMPDHEIPGINDSKKVSEKQREELFERIREEALSFGIGIISEERIDEINILQATYEAMRMAVSKLNPVPELLINDAVTIPGMPMRQIPVIKGDAKCYSIAAASILAKVTRDRIMREYDLLYPEYGFAGHKGYGSGQHIEAIQKYGPCPIHRRTFIHAFI